MNIKNRYLIDLDILSAVEGDTLLYAADLNNTLLFMNVTHRHFFKKIFQKEPDGLTTMNDRILQLEGFLQGKNWH